MRDEIKSIYNIYESNASINHTTRHRDSYTYAPQEYSFSREESEENTAIKKNITDKLAKCFETSKTGNKEAYNKIIFDLQDVLRQLHKVVLNK